MIKINIIVINPTSVNTMKAICNAIISNIVNIIIFGDKEKIKVLCDKLNISIGILRIIQCSTEKEIVFKIQKYQEQVAIKGIIIDEIKDNKIKEQLKCIPLCHIIDFGVFRKSVFILNISPKTPQISYEKGPRYLTKDSMCGKIIRYAKVNGYEICNIYF